MIEQKASHDIVQIDSKITSVHGIKYRWNMPTVDEQLVRSLAYANNLSLPIAHILCARGYTKEDEVRSFIFSSFDKELSSALQLKGAKIAVARIIKAVRDKEKILIFGDYDVDGATSSALILAALIPLGANINYHLPHREKEGYGLSVEAVKKAVRCGYKLIVTVDNGISALPAAKTAKELGIDLIITDHHRPHGELPPALAIVNPNQKDCSYPFKQFAGVGVIFKIICLIYEELGITELPDKLYELLLLGTVADVVPLIGENRFWVKFGLNKINQKRSFSISALIANSGLTKAELDSLDIGFMIAPQINALGRLDDSREAVRFLISSQEDEVIRIAGILKTMNEERKRVERRIFDDVEAAIFNKQIDLDNEAIIVAASNSWPAGVIGLVAGKLMHTYGRPAILLHLDGSGFAKGSCRSIPEFNIFDALESNKDLLINFGGHSCAAGLKLKQDDLPILKKNIEARIKEQIPFAELRPKITLDATLELPEINQKFCTDLAQLEPFGNQNPQPTFLIKNVVQLRSPQILKDKHVKCSIFSQGIIKPVIFFNRPDLYKILQEQADKPFSIAGHVVKNEWEGSVKIELQGLDIKLD